MYIPENDIEKIFSAEWFSPAVLGNFQWEHKYFLYLIPAIPFLLLIRWAIYYQFRQKFDIAIDQKNIHTWNLTGLLRFVPYFFMVLFVSLILVALARPQRTNERIEHWTEGKDIILVLDISESMLLEDIYPNRLEAAKAVAKDFIRERKNDRIGLVVFAGEAYSVVPLTSDLQMTLTSLDEVSHEMIEEGGTAIGNAIGVSINRLRESEAKGKAVILISDGDNTAGNLDPIAAASLANEFQIRIYTIGIGADGMIPFGQDEKGRTRFVKSELDEKTLRKVAERSQGSFFRASALNGLQEIFTEIDRLERSPVMQARYEDTHDYYRIYLTWAVIFFLCWLFLKNTFMSNALED